MSPIPPHRAVPSDPGSPPRPLPRSLRRTVRDWLVWFGPGRLAAALVAGAVVVAGGVAVVRTPPPASSSLVDERTGGAVGAGAGATTPLPVVTLVGVAPTTVAVSSLVHVAGAVHRPGVHEVDSGARVVDALDSAGGARSDAVLDALNLAAPVVDGQRIYVPVEGEAVPGPEVSDTADGALPVVPLDVNRATATELEALPGVGPAIAAAIVDDRTRNGPFPSVDELFRVRGIGPAKLGAMRDLVVAR